MTEHTTTPTKKPALTRLLASKRLIYILLFAMPALLGAVLVSLVLGASAIMFWLCTTVLWISGLVVAYFYGKQQEQDAALNMQHVMMSLRATALLAIVIVAYQWQAGNLGPDTEDKMCARFCKTKSFAAGDMQHSNDGSVMCYCSNNSNLETFKASLGEVMLQDRQIKQ